MNQNSNNQDYENNADGFALGGGATKRKLTISEGDVSIQGGAAPTAGKVLTADGSGNGTYEDIPTLNQDTTGKAGTVTSLSGHSNTELSNGAGYVPNTRNVAGQPLSSDVTIGVTDLTATGTMTSSYFLAGDNVMRKPTNTTYAEISEAEITTGTASTVRSITARRVTYILGKASTLISNAISALTKSDVGLENVDNTSNVTERAATATLTNKDLSSTTNTFPDFYPVGTQYTNLSNSANPSTYLPGQSGSTWVANSGTVTVAKAATGTFSTAGATGGAETHTLTVDELASHTHKASSTAPRSTSNGTINDAYKYGFWNNGTPTTSTGGDQAHNNLQPYIVKYVWDRTA